MRGDDDGCGVLEGGGDEATGWVETDIVDIAVSGESGHVFAGFDVGEDDALVLCARCDVVAVWGDGEGINCGCVLLDDARAECACRIPDTDRAVDGAGDENGFIVWEPLHAGDAVSVACKWNWFGGVAAPQPDDALRQAGFSKDGKMAESQIVLGLLVSEDGYPMSYSIFNGSQYEGRTMIPVIDDFVQRFKLTDFIVVADSGLMNTKNVELLESAGYRYIIGARIRNESPKIKDWILAIDRTEGNILECRKNDRQRLVVSYSDARAKKNAWNRDKGVVRLRKVYAKGTLAKENVNKRGYNKFLREFGIN